MVINYSLSENDYLYFQLYTAALSPITKKRKLRNWLVFAFISFLFAIYFYKTNEKGIAIYFSVVGLIWLVFYKTYFKWKYKKHYLKFIRQNYKNRFGQNIELTFKKDYINSKEKVGEGKIKISEVEYVANTKPYFFIKMTTGSSFIIPKNQINISELQSKFKALNLVFVNHTDWKL